MTIKIPAEVERALIYESERRGVSKSSLVREALVAYLGDSSDDEPSFYEVTKDLIGTAEGPKDLSTNPKYLEDLGADSVREDR